jgi:transcriptional regulator with PAS, ATPase and Fis domain
VLAEDIHKHSLRNSGTFVAVNCASISTTLFESEFFGHCRGAYTSAIDTKPGLVEIADRGTLFLDEVGELPLESQAKLLRFLSKGTFWPVGGAKERSADVRVIAATNRDLRARLDSGFRADLFFRLSVVEIHIPALEHLDLKLLSRTFAAEIAARHNRKPSAGEIAAIADVASTSHFPGGARELHNVIERYFLLSDPERPVADNWRLINGLSVCDRRRARADAESLPVSGDMATAMERLDVLSFVVAARHAGSVRLLSQQLNCSNQAVYLRLQRLRLRPQDLGLESVMSSAVAQARQALLPYLPWIQGLLTSFTDT